MAIRSTAFSVLKKAMDRLAELGVVDVHRNLSARLLPPEKPGAQERAEQLAGEAIAQLHGRGLEKFAAALSVELGTDLLAPARLAGSHVEVAEDFLKPPPLAGAIGKAVLAAAKGAGAKGKPGAPPAGGRTLTLDLSEGVGTQAEIDLEPGAAPTQEQLDHAALQREKDRLGDEDPTTPPGS